MHQKIVDVLIVGAGPTGLTLACELRRRGIQIRLIDKMPARTTQSRALGLQARSLEIFEKLGVLDSILERPSRRYRQALRKWKTDWHD
jgi:2-polyprenyl-6-methoxyphenol hydroxylase-like FAD-dependent oxidoreductase